MAVPLDKIDLELGNVTQKRRSSGNIVAVAGAVKEAMDDKRETAGKNCDDDPFMTVDDHKIDLEELMARLGTSLDEGLSNDAAKRLIAKNGPNEPTPPPKTPEVVKCIQESTSCTSFLLCTGVSFASYSIACSQPS